MTINSEFKGTTVMMTRLYCRSKDSPFAQGIVILYLKGVSHAGTGNKAFMTADYLRSRLYCTYTYLDDWFILY